MPEIGLSEMPAGSVCSQPSELDWGDRALIAKLPWLCSSNQDKQAMELPESIGLGGAVVM